MVVQRDALGQRGVIVWTDEAVLLFVAIDAAADAAGVRDLPLNRVEFGLRGEVEIIPVLAGSCRMTDAATSWRAETICDATTAKGRFAVTFVTIDGATESVRPNEAPAR